jgi:energy-coupling factor transport system ATP-binding protein
MRPTPGGTASSPVCAAACAVRLRGVAVTYNHGTPFARPALGSVDLDLPEGGVTGVIGPTAAGKSTLLQVMVGLLPVTSGTVSVFGAATPAPGEVGMVFQRPEVQLYCATVGEDVAVAPTLRGLAPARVSERVRWALETVGLDHEAFASRPPHELSVGEQRRVAIAGILSMQPRLLVLDEPGSGLDPRGRVQLLHRLVAWAREPGRTLVFTSHDVDEVAELADTVVVVGGGGVLAAGPTKQVLSRAELLAGVGLAPPLTARLAAALEPAGGDVGGDLPLTAAQLAAWLQARAARRDAAEVRGLSADVAEERA